MRETLKRRLPGTVLATCRRRSPLAVECLERRLTLSHTPFATPNDAHVYEPEAHETSLGFASSEFSNAEYAKPASGYLGMPSSMLGGPGLPSAQRRDDFASLPSMSRESTSPFVTSERATYDAPYAAPLFGTMAPAPAPSVQLALIIPNSGQFDPLLVVIVDRTIVGILQPSNYRIASSTPGGDDYAHSESYTHPDSYGHFDTTAAPPAKPPAPSGARGAAQSDYSLTLPVGDMRVGGESPAAHPALAATAGLAGGIGLANGNSGPSAQAYPGSPSLLIPGVPHSDATSTPGFGLLVPPGEAGPALRERAPVAVDAEVAVEPASAVDAAARDTAVTTAALPDAAGSLDEVGQTAAMLDAIGLRIDAVDQALEGALAEIERLGGEFASWLGEFGLGTWSVPTGAAAALGAGAYFSLRGARRGEDEEHEEESSSWLFSRLQTPTGHA